MAKEKKQGFEAYLKEIEKIVDELESGDIELDEAIKKYEKGMVLVKQCAKALKEARMKIEVLKKKTEDGYEAEEMEDEKDIQEDDEEEAVEGSEDDDDEDEDEGLF